MGGFQRGGTGGSDPPEKSPNIGLLSILVRYTLKSQSCQASIRCWDNREIPFKLDPLGQNFLDPRIQLGNYVLYGKSTFMGQGHHVLTNS